MKLQVFCNECFFDGMKFEIQEVEMNNDGLFEFTCSQGHNRITIIQMEKFEALFDIGTDALMNGYKTEALVSFATSLERFYEWFVKVVCLKNSINYEIIIESWKPISKRTEQQIGAFQIMFLREFNQPSPKLNNNKTFFRNQVVHNGYIPSYDEVLEYGEYVLSFIQDILDKMGNDYKDYYHINFLNQIEILQEKYMDLQTSTVAIPTIIGLINDSNRKTMDEAIAHIESRNKQNESMMQISKDYPDGLGEYLN